jgi:hypothetical protein
VVANQVAFYHLTVLEAAAKRAVAAASDSSVIAAVKRDAISPPLPAAVACTQELCGNSALETPQCAYQYLPRFGTPDIGAIMVNDTAAAGEGNWQLRLPPGQHACDRENRKKCSECAASGKEDCGPRCFLIYERGCSYTDHKTAFRGTSANKPLTLSFTDMFQCKIWIGEPPYEWSKPTKLANWRKELKVKLNGQDVPAEARQVHASNYIQMMVVDARAVLGGKCRRQEVRVELRVEPLGPMDHECSGKDANKPKCELSHEWDGGWRGAACTTNEHGPGKEKVRDGCWKEPRYRNKMDIETFVAWAIAF